MPMDWTEILKRAGIPEPPGYWDTVEHLHKNPPPPRTKKKSKPKK